MMPPHIERANDIFRARMRQTPYSFVWRKLNRARRYMLEQANRELSPTFYARRKFLEGFRTSRRWHEARERNIYRRWNCTCESDPLGRCVIHNPMAPK